MKYDGADAAIRPLREQYAFPFQLPTQMSPVLPVPVRDELQLAALACALGATGCGGALSAAEAELVAAALACKPPDALAVATLHAAIRAGNDPLGEIFCRLRPAADRRLIGAFYTPSAIVEAMVEWALAQDVCRMVDPGCGSGRFVAAAPEVKAWAQRAGKQLGLPVSGLTGLHGLFFLATALHARAGDVGCFVTSAEWLDTGYGAVLRELLTSRLGLRGLTLIDPEAVPFDGAMTTALITRFVDRRSASAVTLQHLESAERIDLDQSCKTVPLQAMATARRWGPFLTREAATGARAH